jgi:hypothetical protein
MAITRKRYPAAQAMQPYLVDIVGRVAIGSSGAVGTQTGKGFSVTRTGAGLYTISISGVNSQVPAILFADVSVGFATGSTPYTATVLTMSATSANVTIQVSALSAPGTAADPPSGSFIMLRLVVQNFNITQ